MKDFKYYFKNSRVEWQHGSEYIFTYDEHSDINYDGYDEFYFWYDFNKDKITLKGNFKTTEKEEKLVIYKVKEFCKLTQNN